ncbi:MAG: triose-phosphate isomerase [Desulfobacteraceae bacterium]|nr:triose-phosphate isomerase [Desulfobacteraceae bacterium]
MDSRRPLIAGNWKMHKTGKQAVDSIRQLKDLTSSVTDVEIMVAPPFTALSQISAELGAGGNIALGAQNMHWESEGAFTGEISANMLKSAGCRYVILGHSERRQFFGETDQTVNKKIKAALSAGLAPVLCVGETEKQRNENKTFNILDKQIKIGLENFVLNALQSLVVAYEPVWAIGTGKTATTDQAQEVHNYLRKWFAKEYGTEFSQKLRILYGGSVKPANIKDLMAMPDIDGALVGGASLDPNSLSQLVHYKS